MADEVVSALQKELVEALAACRAANERAELERTACRAANERAELERTAREAVDAALRATTVELNVLSSSALPARLSMPPSGRRLPR
jgi:hypothetical protein